MAALTRCYSLSQNVKKVADFTFHRLQNIPRSPEQCQFSRQFVTLSKVEPKKYQLFLQTSLRNFKTKVPEIVPQSSKPGLLSQLLKPLGFTVLVASTSLVTLLSVILVKVRDPKRKKKTSQETYQQFLRVIIVVMGINCAVLVLWKAPTLQNFMSRYFTSANGNPVISMVLSAFSHTSVVHLLINMYCFWTFLNPIYLSIRNIDVFSWVYLNGAVVSSLASLILKAVRASSVPSVGASGAILTCIACVCYTFPKTTLGFPIISDMTGFYFTAENGLKGLILLDICGIIFRWKMIDHAGHLGGVLFGLWYMHYGRHQIQKLLQLLSGGKS